MSPVKVVPISGRRGAFVCGSVAFSSGTFSLSSHQDMKDVMTQIHGSTQRDDIVPILDVDSFDRRFLNTDLIKEIQGTGVYKLMSGTEGYKYGTDPLAGGFSTAGEKPVTAAGTVYYPYALLDADGSVAGYHSNLLVKVVYGANGASITGVSLIEVTPEQTTERTLS